MAFSLFHSVLLVIHFNDGLPLHSLVDSKQWDSQYLVDRLDVLNFPEETSWSTQALMCILILLYHVRTMFSCVDFGIHHLLSLRQCLFEKGVSSRYSVTIRTQVLKVKWYHSQGSFVLPGCMVDFHEEITILFSKRNSGWVHELSSNHSRLGPLGN